tara:strand:- start:42 stop:245 length:204 start_codon:yes stop_codon:yes gene_type:complete
LRFSNIESKEDDEGDDEGDVPWAIDNDIGENTTRIIKKIDTRMVILVVYQYKKLLKIKILFWNRERN